MSTFEDEVRDAIRALADHAPLSAPSLLVIAPSTHRRRRPVLAAAAIAVSVAVAALGARVLLVRHNSEPVTVSTDGATAVGTAALPSGPLGARSLAVSAWTGNQWLIWGGIENNDVQPDDGASYDPTTAEWTKLPPAPLAGRQGAASVWTGKKWIVYGGRAGAHSFVDGASYDPHTRTWRSLPAAPSSLSDPTNTPAEAVWTGTTMLVIAGGGAGAYDPTTRTWSTLPAVPGEAAADIATTPAVWTGSQAVFLLGSPYVPSTTAPVNPTSSPPPTIKGPDLVPSARPVAVPTAPAQNGFYLAAYDVLTKHWSVLPAGGFGGDVAPDLVWTGRTLVTIDLWSDLSQSPQIGTDGKRVSRRTGTNASYNFRTRRWSSLPPFPVGLETAPATAEWTGTSILLWDGGATVITYNPSTGTWSSFTGAPRPELQSPVTAWTGDSLLVWGGLTSDLNGPGGPTEVTSAARYVPHPS